MAESCQTRLRQTETSTFNIRTDCFICGTSNNRKEKLTNITTGTGALTHERIIAAALERWHDKIHMRMLSYSGLFASPFIEILKEGRPSGTNVEPSHYPS